MGGGGGGNIFCVNSKKNNFFWKGGGSVWGVGGGVRVDVHEELKFLWFCVL